MLDTPPCWVPKKPGSPTVLLALVVAVLAVALGAAVTAVSGARPLVLGPLRTFAATAAAAVVLTHLLPDALGGAGLWGGLLFLVGLLGPLALHPLTERLASRSTKLSPAKLALEAGFIGLLVHHVGDGLGIGAYAALPGGVLQHLDVILALIAHTVPLVAVVTLAYRSEYDLGVALRRAGALALTSALGVGVSFAVPGAALASAAAWIGALVSGVLLHVVTHDWLEDLPTNNASRALDFAAAVFGLSLVLLGGHEPGHESDARALFDAALVIGRHSAPFLALALALDLLLAERLRQELDKLGQSLPVVLGRRLGFALGAEGLLLGLAFYGLPWTLAAFAATTFVPVVAGTVALLSIALAGEKAAERAKASAAALLLPPSDSSGRFDRITALWLVSVALAAALQTSLPRGALYGSLGQPSEFLSSGLFGGLLGTGGPSVVALSALTEKGLSPGAALVAAALTSALGLGVLRELWRGLGRGALAVVIWLVCLTGVLGIALNQVAPITHPLRLPEIVGKAAAWLLAAGILGRALQVGVRRWLAGWFAGRAGENAGHGHAHGHGHGHGHGQ